MIASLQALGWTLTRDPSDASTILVNTCGFIESAKQESINTTLEFLQQSPEARVVMTGCLSQRYPEELATEIPELAGVFGNRAPETIGGFLDRMAGTSSQKPLVEVPEATVQRPLRSDLFSFPGSAYLKVSEGCDNRCSFCAIPLIRGRMRSRPPADVLAEVDDLLRRGVREINLVAQDLASYGRDLSRLGVDAREATQAPAELIRAITERDGDFWIRLLYVYPDRFPESFLELCASDARILPYFDIPFQHASSSVLKRMGRPGSRKGYLDLIRRIRDALPDSVIRTSLMVGFFGETDEAFSELLEFQKQAELDWVGVFAYSPEDGTKAMRGDPELDVAPELAEERASIVREAQIPITQARMDRLVGKTLDVLVEENVPEEPLSLGRCYAHAPEVDGAVVINTQKPLEPGSFVRCAIARRNGLDVEAVAL